MDLVTARLTWSAPVRMLGFWILTAFATVFLYGMVAQMPLSQALPIVGEAMSGNIERLSTREFAFSLAGFIAAIAGGLAIGFFMFHAVLVSLAIASARHAVSRSLKKNGGPGFLAARSELRAKLGRHPILGEAWRSFDDTLVAPEFSDEPLRQTLRVQTFFNASVARDRLAGLKMMPSIPGYFVGIGLLLTFFGLVLALNEAAIGTTSNEVGAMRLATARLLQVATFKFASSIAGLGASIILSILFRAYAIVIETAFDVFCRTVEQELVFAPPQTATLEMNRLLLAQLDELRDLNGPAFGDRLAVAVAPPLQLAMLEAVQPLSAMIADAVGRLDDHSRSGLEELLKRFTDSVRGGAGTELRELSVGLKALQSSLERTHQSLSGSGIDFSNRMAQTAESLNQLILQAGNAIGTSANSSSATLQQMVGALQIMFERAHGQIDADLTGAAAGAAARLEAAMGSVLTKLEAQIAQLQTGLGGFQADISQQLSESRKRSFEAQEASLAIVDRATAAAAGVLESGFSSVIREINSEVDRMVQSMRVAEIAMVAQAGSIKDASVHSKAVADAFGRTADLVRTASVPLLESGDRMASASDRMAQSMTSSVAALEESQRAAKRLADHLSDHIGRLTAVWTDYEARFGQVDADLGVALTRLSEETRRQLEILAQHTSAIDQGLALAVDRLSGHVAGIAEGTGDLAETVELLRSSLLARAAE